MMCMGYKVTNLLLAPGFLTLQVTGSRYSCKVPFGGPQVKVLTHSAAIALSSPADESYLELSAEDAWK